MAKVLRAPAFLAVDIGNTNIRAALVTNGRLGRVIRFSSALPLRPPRSFSKFSSTSNIAVSSVNPKAAKAFARLTMETFGVKPKFAGEDFPIPLNSALKNPDRAGTDRRLCALAAFERIRGPVIVLGFGTALTVDAVNSQGKFLGGAIAPGPGLAAKALAEHCALLPDREFRATRNYIGNTTQTAMDSGIYNGYIGLTAGLVSGMKLSIGRQAAVLATGGGAVIFWRAAGANAHVPNLVLEGLALAACASPEFLKGK